MRCLWICTATLAATMAVEGAQPDGGDGDVAALLARIGARVEEFYARARTVTSRETVRLQQLEADFRPAGLPRQLVYDLRVAWERPDDGGPPPEASVLRHLVTVNGRPPRPRDEPQCTDPQEVSPDSLSMFLPQNRVDYEFKLVGPSTVDGRRSLSIDFRSISKKKPEVIWKGSCVRLSLPGRTRGRIWIDAGTYDVLRMDEHLVGMFDFRASAEVARRSGTLNMALERFDSSIRYREVKFDDPVETLTLPRIIETTTAWRGGGMMRQRITQEFSQYRRFITGGRIVAGDELR